MHVGSYTLNEYISASCRDMASEFSNFWTLGQARDFFESFQWTDEALRDLEAVNTDGTHTVSNCGNQVAKK